MPSGPFGPLENCAYTADDGVTYVVGIPQQLRETDLGLPLATPGLTAFPALWLTRYAACRHNGTDTIDGAKKFVHVPCNRNNSLFQIGPGTHLVIDGHEYVITACVGERRID